MADKYKIMSDATMGIFDQQEMDITGLSNGVDEYMKETCLELLEYMLQNCVAVCLDSDGNKKFLYKTEIISKEQLFQNFL